MKEKYKKTLIDDFKKGASFSQDLIDKYPDHYDFYLKKAYFLFQLEKYNESKKELEVIIQKSNEQFEKIDEVYYYIGMNYFMKKNYNKAIDNYEKAIKKNPKNPNYFLNIAQVFEKKNRHNEAKENYIKGIIIYPRYSYVFLKEILEKSNNNIIEIFKKALEKSNKDRQNDFNPNIHFIKKIIKTIEVSKSSKEE